MNKAATLIATLFHIGFFPKAPGTVGSFAALLLALPILIYGKTSFLIIFLILATIAGFWSAELYSKKANIEDPKEVVIDEVVGQWIVLLFITPQIWWHWLLAFVLFRLFDIIKPFPVDYFDTKIKGGAGIMLDDIAAGIMASIIMLICMQLLSMI